MTGVQTCALPICREDATPTRTDVYSVDFVFPDHVAIKAELTTAYPLPQPAAAAGAAPAPGAAAAAVPPTCGITLQYLPPRWIAQF